MAESTWLQTAAASLLTAALTLAGTSCQQSHLDERADREKFLDGAQVTAQETSRLLDEGYNALAQLLKGMDQKGWREFSKGPADDYMEFHRRWRQQLIAQHFKLSRYYGKDMANDLIHIDEIDRHPVDNLQSPNPCTPAGSENDFDIAKLALQTECYARFATLQQDIINDKIKEKNTDDLFDTMGSQRDTVQTAWKLIEHYDKSSVSFLRRLNAKFTQ
ncbi:hypothetical protein D9M71_333550 [compost metagenome]